LGFGVGKIAASAGVKKVGVELTKEAITAAAKRVATQSGGRISEKAAAASIRTEAAKTAAKYQVIGALGAEAPIAAAQDYFLQDVMLETGVQDEYSFMQTLAATALGGLGAVPSLAVSYSLRGSTANTVGEKISEAEKLRTATSAKRAAPRIKKALEKKMSEWEKLAEAGKALPDNPKLYDAISDWFFDTKNEDSLFRIVVEEGADLDINSPRWSDEIINYANNMGPEALEEFNKALAPLNITFGEVTTRVAGVLSRAGEVFSPASRAKQFYKEFRNLKVGKDQAEKTLAETAAEEAENVKVPEKQWLLYTQSVWKKTVVSTWQTTGVNVAGWGLARAFQGLSDVTHAGALLGTAGIRSVINPAAGAKDLAKMRGLLANQKFALSTMVDPFMTAKAFREALELAPKKVKKRVTGQIFGGIDQFSPERFGFDSTSKGVKAVEKTTDFFQTLSFVHLQDTLTKGVSGMIALDKETRLAFGKGFYDMVDAGETNKITAEMWDKVGQAVLKETFSEDLTKGTNMFSWTARYLEGLSNSAVGGFLVPFGRFVNATAAFMYNYSPAGLATPMFRAIKGRANEDAMERVARAAAGSMALIYMYSEEEKKQAEGLQWNERRRSDGSVEDITNLFPYSVYALVGRIGVNAVRGEGMDKGLIEALKQQMGPFAALEDVAGGSLMRDIINYATSEEVPEDEKRGVFGAIADFSLFLGGAAAGVAAGFTRPLAVYSNVASTLSPEAGGGRVADAKQAEGIDKIVLDLTRNTSAFFNFAFGEETEEGVRLFGAPRYSATSPGISRIANPADAILGSIVKAPPTKLNKVLGQVDKPPFLVDSFSSGVPEYDAFINQHVQPLLEQRAADLLENPMWKGASQSLKIDMVDKMLSYAEKDVLAMLEGRQVGGMEERLNRERAKLLSKDRNLRRRAIKALGITNPEHKLSLYEIEAIRRYMDYEEDQLKTLE
jgi:hypothetical protein